MEGTTQNTNPQQGNGAANDVPQFILELRTGKVKDSKTGQEVGKVDMSTINLVEFRNMLAQHAESEGYTGMAEHLRKTPKDQIPFEKKFNAVWRRNIETRDVAFVLAGGLVIGLVWEGTRYLFRNKVRLPGFINYTSGAYAAGGAVKAMPARAAGRG